MNSCERFETDLSAWLDDELARPEQLLLLDHLVSCTACRAFAAQARSLEGWVATVRPPRDAVQPSPALWEEIQRSAATASAPVPSRRSAWSSGWRAAAVVIVSVGVGLLFTGSPGTPDPGDRVVEVRLGEDPEGMDDSRFMELTTEVLRADPRYHAALYQVMQQVVRDSGAREMSMEFFGPDDAAEERVLTEAVNRNPV